MIEMAKRQTLHIWIALLAVLFSALAPSISHALAAAGADTVEVCTVSGYKVVKLAPGDGGKAPPSARRGMEHCAFCATHGGADAIPTAPAAALLAEAGRDIYPSLFYAAPLPLHAWSAAHARAPPLLA